MVSDILSSTLPSDMLSVDMHKENLPYLSTPISKHFDATQLFADFLANLEKTREYFGPVFDDEAALGQLFSQLQERSYPREELALALKAMAAEIGAPARARTQIDNLRKRDSLVVFAGQQPGLFTGPLYTVYKALSVERWAAELSDKFSVPIVPCFWLGSDDHDFAEVNHIHLPAKTDISTIVCEPKQDSIGLPVGRLKLDVNIQSVMTELFDFLPETEFKLDVFETLAETYAVGLTYPLAFARLWYRMFPQSQLVFVSPSHRDLKKLAEPVMQQALCDATRLFSIYDETSTRLQHNGYHQQVHKNSAQTFLFYQHNERHNIRRDNSNNYNLGGEKSVTIDHVCKMLAETPEDFSGNVLLNPIIQNTLFPTLGVVLGPSEIAYYAQIGDLHDYFDVPRPAIMPRTSVTLVQQNINRHLSQYDIALDALQQDVNSEISRVLNANFPEELDNGFLVAEQKIQKAFEEVQSIITQFEPDLDKTAKTAADRALRELERLAKKAHAAHRRKDRNTERQIRRLALHLFPDGDLQERHYNIVYFWVRYGPDFLSKLYRDWPVGLRNHLIWELE